MSCSSICLFHDRQYSSNVQCILNLLRKYILNTKCDLNMIAKKSLCTCNLAEESMTTIDEQLIDQQNEFEKLKTDLMRSRQCLENIDYLIQSKIMIHGDNKISKYKLFKLICDISDKNKFCTLMQKHCKVQSTKRLVSKDKKREINPIHRRIELSFPSNKIGRLLGRHGNIHKSITSRTKTRIHFDNVPYSISSRTKSTDFNLDLFQSTSSTVTAMISGRTTEAVNTAAEALIELDKVMQEKNAGAH
ncbi:unnamed protein product [Adineta steineri]|uniref:K Homology domain-containing protein n=1 Tax=Adineta steineri TaxID=433720 RepID=A0A814LZD7_9BILA|nr:unnamed protein product [Adineta steineri]CAF1071755.1 unnamed protein product [Adineta steineri]CAF3915998.1 unnamed protein product [Adineta steineri]